jgi:hypothetical protein
VCQCARGCGVRVRRTLASGGDIAANEGLGKELPIVVNEGTVQVTRAPIGQMVYRRLTVFVTTTGYYTGHGTIRVK